LYSYLCLVNAKIPDQICEESGQYFEYEFICHPYLYGDIDETVYMKLSGFEEKGKKNYVCQLNISVYGTKQSRRQ